MKIITLTRNISASNYMVDTDCKETKRANLSFYKSRMMKPVCASLLCLGLLASCGGETTDENAKNASQNIEAQNNNAPPQDNVDQNAEAKRFTSMLDRHARMFVENSPETATQLGLDEALAGEGYEGRLSSAAFLANQAARNNNEEFLIEIKSISRDALPPDMAVTYDILRNAYRMGAQRNQFSFGDAQYWGSSAPYRITQLSGVHLALPRLLQTQHPLNNQQDIENYLSRLAQISRVLDETSQMIRADAEVGVTPPVFALTGAGESIGSFISSAPADNPLVSIFFDKIKKIDGVDHDDYKTKAETLLEEDVYPAYARLKKVLEDLVSQSPEGAGIWRIGQQGEDFYQHALDSYGAQGKSGEEIHELGLAEVARITKEMDAILKSQGFNDGSVSERMDNIGKLAENRYDNDDAGRAVLLGDLNIQVDEIMEKAGDWFGTLPDQSVEVRRIPVYEQDTSPGGYYTGPSLDGVRPGIYWINLKNTADWPKFTLKTLTYHEAVPGHHFQISLQRAIKDMPLVRNLMFFSEFSEGWALYTEQVAAEMGMYENDPLSNLGRLQSELFRAARLVTDSGLHHKKWTREEAIDYMVSVTGNTRDYLTREVERYAVWPGQATSYKLGMLKIGELRKQAEQELGDAFDIREFHDEVLLTGSMPLPVLDAKISRWIAAKKGA